MTENIDTYVLPNDSDVFLAEVLPTSDPLRVTWGVLTETEKESYLSAALWKLEDFTFKGEKAIFYQPLKFPRIARGLPLNFEKAPLEIKRAQALIAADLARVELYVKKRNQEACEALGLLQTATAINYSDKVTALLTKWLTTWRKV